MAGEGAGDFEYVSPWVDELERMPGGTPALHGAARALVDAVFPFDRAYRAVVRSCAVDDGPPPAVATPYAHAMALQPAFSAAHRRLDGEIESLISDWLVRQPDGDVAACEVLQAGRVLLERHEAGADVSDAARALRAATDRAGERRKRT